ncbi:MAG TPA: mannose-1-phosphate guanylyltransferase/mannose-6-phosphate isomerase [Gammaproteobacteria bacterium]|nr:mannose-1-phosphate guanylyltransferase/mannose-6-phosphate isomerase [Gammaproteobacteria bacterium]
MIPVVLSGGSGTRLWPLSREGYPKQFLPLVGADTMLQATVNRIVSYPGVSAPIVVCNEEHRFFVAEQLNNERYAGKHIILEPAGRNTAPAVTLAALQALSIEEDPLLIVMPADHVITNIESFHKSISVAVAAAEQGMLVTFGVRPTHPNTGYGYIKAEGGRVPAEITALKIDRFVEKPDIERATEYVESGEYLWNSGIFLFKASAFLQEVKRLCPDVESCCRTSLEKASADSDFLRADRTTFLECPSDSIDYAIFERTDRAAVVPMEAGWSDVGSWNSLWEVGEHDEHGNRTDGDVLAIDTKGCYLHAEDRLLTAIGVKDLVIVETGDAILVMDKNRNEDVKNLVGKLKHHNRQEAVSHRRVPRPWGSFNCIEQSERFQVKHITVKPGHRLSLQMHHHRAEHWIVVKGTAKITRGDEEFVLSENESTYIPVGVKHRLENPGKIPLELIEVQSGSYLGEDDIVRFEDSYGR